MKKTIFVSSTYHDLASHRNEVWDLLEEFDVAVRGMEEFGARTESALETCLTEVEQSDIYIGIIAFRLGSIEESTQKSYTQLEYERALELNKEILIYLIDEENSRVPIKFIDRDFKGEKLESFKRKLRENHTVDTFVTEEDLVQKLRRNIRRYIDEKESKEVIGNEFEEAKKTIDKFLLIPKATAGREVRLEVEINGSPFPVSREFCSAFNLDFGATVGIPISILSPVGYEKSGLNQLILTSKLFEEFHPISAGEKRHIYAKLLFSESEISEVKTRFKTETTYIPPNFQASIANFEENYFKGKTIVHKPEGKVILLLTKSGIELSKKKNST